MKIHLAYDLYLLGPMTGFPDDNHPLFDEWTERLRKKNFRVCNPAELDRIFGKPDSYEECIARDMTFLPKCKSGAALPGWEKSKGARWEVYTLTTMLNRQVLLLPTMTAMSREVFPEIIIPELDESTI